MTMTTMKMLSEMRLTNPVLWFVKITWINRTRKGFANIICVLALKPRVIHKENLTFPYISFTFWDYEQFHVYHLTFFPYIIILIHTSIIIPLVQDKAKYYRKIFHSDWE